VPIPPATERAAAAPSVPRAVPRGAPSPLLGLTTLVVSLVAIAWFFVVLTRDVDAANFAQVEPASSRVDFGPGWVDPRWEARIVARLAELPPLAADSDDTRAAVEGALLELPFVAEVGTYRVLWPDGLRVEVRLRSPVACVRAGDVFLTLSEDAVVLPGAWSSPPARDHGFLPLLAIDDATRAELGEGVVLATAAVVDGLAVARALELELGADDWTRLGRIVIDARRAREASVELPGTMLWLENGRRVLFGRSPNLDEPGELPYAAKCASLSRALRQFDPAVAPEGAVVDWELADVRWDHPALLPRGGAEEESRE
jgi:hypothetical protein